MQKKKAEKETLPAVKPDLPQMGERGIEIRNLDDLFKMASWIFASPFKPKACDSPAAIAVQIQFGMELGLGVMASVRNIAVINGQPSIYGPIGLGIVRASGLLEDFNQHFEGTWPQDNFKAVCMVKRRGEHPITKEWSVVDDKIAGLWMVNVHKTFPKDMLMYRATWRALYAGFADKLKGVLPAEMAEEQIIDAKFEEVSEKLPQTKSDRLAAELAESWKAPEQLTTAPTAHTVISAPVDAPKPENGPEPSVIPSDAPQSQASTIPGNPEIPNDQLRYIKSIKKTQGLKRDGEPWVRYDIELEDGVVASTFSKSEADVADVMRQKHIPVVAETKWNKQYKSWELVSIEAAR